MDRAPTTDDLQGPATVSQLTWWIRELVEGGIPPVWVEGELGRFTQHRSGHWYFNLRDSDATISCAMFRGANRHVSWRPREGQQVLVFGRVGVYPPRGNYQLIVERMQPAGHGARQLALARLKARLAGEGLFATERKRPLPRFPRTIGVATSATGAALRDILKVLRRRAPGVTVLVAPCAVQGEHAPAQIIKALELLQRDGRAEVILCGRGGGSQEDLWCFHDEGLVRAIASCSVPVISCVGHEIDHSLSDLAADHRAATPSAGAEAAVPEWARLAAHTRGLERRLAVGLQRDLARRRAQVDGLTGRLRDPRRRLELQAQRVDEARARLEQAMLRRLVDSQRQQRALQQRLQRSSPDARVARSREYVATLQRRLSLGIRDRHTRARALLEARVGLLHALSPLGSLARGYAIAFPADGERPLRHAVEVEPGSAIRLRLHEGALEATVTMSHPQADVLGRPVPGD